MLLKVSAPNWGWQEFVVLEIILLKKTSNKTSFLKVRFSGGYIKKDGITSSRPNNLSYFQYILGRDVLLISTRPASKINCFQTKACETAHVLHPKPPKTPTTFVSTGRDPASTRKGLGGEWTLENTLHKLRLNGHFWLCFDVPARLFFCNPDQR